ncbi:membrane peptidoglycan carboxypeptidase, partial [Thermocatellispora tengchongensis]|nr:membrane peptidoglycan carboxypeptidase [Thermocatellispora tengchongensis]
MQERGEDQSGLGSKILRLAGIGAAAGVLVAGIALPAVGGVGFGVITATDELNLKPTELKEPPPPEVSRVLDADGEEIAQFYEEYREAVKLDQIADVMKTAIISIEDFRFY